MDKIMHPITRTAVTVKSPGIPDVSTCGINSSATKRAGGRGSRAGVEGKSYIRAANHMFLSYCLMTAFSIGASPLYGPRPMPASDL